MGAHSLAAHHVYPAHCGHCVRYGSPFLLSVHAQWHMHIYTAWDLICCPVTHVPCADCLCCAKYALALPIHSGGLSVHLCGMPVCTSTACTLCIVILLPHLCILQSNVVALLWLLHRHSKAICGGQAGICILGLLLNGCCRRAYTRRKFELSNSSCVCNAPSCATL